MASIEWEEITLESLAEGQLEIDFQDLLPKVIAAFNEPSTRFEISADGTITYKLQADIQFEKNTKTGGVLVYARMQHKPPKPRSIGGEVKVRSGRMLVEKAQQLILGEKVDTDTGEVQTQ